MLQSDLPALPVCTPESNGLSKNGEGNHVGWDIYASVVDWMLSCGRGSQVYADERELAGAEFKSLND